MTWRLVNRGLDLPFKSPWVIAHQTYAFHFYEKENYFNWEDGIFINGEYSNFALQLLKRTMFLRYHLFDNRVNHIFFQSYEHCTHKCNNETFCGLSSLRNIK